MHSAISIGDGFLVFDVRDVLALPFAHLRVAECEHKHDNKNLLPKSNCDATIYVLRTETRVRQINSIQINSPSSLGLWRFDGILSDGMMLSK